MRTSTMLLCAAACVLTTNCKQANRTESTTAAASNAAVTAGTNASTNITNLRLGEAPVTKAAGCPVSTKDWGAFIQAVHGQRKLVVVGWVQANSGGWKFNLKPGALDKALPPTQHFTLEAIPPSGIVILPITFQQVYAIVDAQPKYRSIVIDCGGEQVGEITDIEERPEIETGPAPVVPDENKS